ncbi:hypothetical protein C8Q69DRAFT_446823 [Paecilomyces variotii]|uniref:ferroxidase n=1 Tax=Byssochlamys spectabilis TaxID=264951 RepID=A0A443HNG4_BYSSP|nr:hypothetical protein C8Q69DRAFT_446823 [Paecilomyces variotii]KAJ9222205.1 hypothetical protein DTO169C6_5495 [Paecilomyces variotii]KAJ9234914.1 hypothetical protein DTO169E5_6381 [Paecilomyces variotii]KAJ9292062.1 hypothetical protein DTO021C3_502 [Paecilomyces variotii]KAJ9299156.1 hypothetical protein DTO217A2_8265 [Paecilomyces variotii]KAJ9312647.1 hypothetical protein DTO271D3_7038 [Paecilomyces variotii]
MFSRTPRALVSARPSFRLARVSQTSTPAAVQRFQTRNRAVLSSSEAYSSRSFHSSSVAFKGITPDSSDPAPPKSQTISADEPSYVTEPSPLTDQEYRECSEHYFNVLLSELEKAQEEGSDMEAEYAAGVLNVIVPSAGTYVLNKQPPNKQIWLSSPISGPRRYDWVVVGDRMHEKQDTRGQLNGQWICLRDGSNLTDLLNKELTLSIPKIIYDEDSS